MKQVTVFDFDTCIREMTSQHLGIVQRHKLVYFAYRTYVLGTGKVPFKNRVEAWPLGPVFPDLQENQTAKGDASVLDELMRNCCRTTIECLGHLSGARLIQLGHARCGEWQIARLFAKPGIRRRITPRMIFRAHEALRFYA
jgi:uncharacterized phage-associated protein